MAFLTRVSRADFIEENLKNTDEKNVDHLWNFFYLGHFCVLYKIGISSPSDPIKRGLVTKEEKKISKIDFLITESQIKINIILKCLNSF